MMIVCEVTVSCSFSFLLFFKFIYFFCPMPKTYNIPQHILSLITATNVVRRQIYIEVTKKRKTHNVKCNTQYNPRSLKKYIDIFRVESVATFGSAINLKLNDTGQRRSSKTSPLPVNILSGQCEHGYFGYIYICANH